MKTIRIVALFLPIVAAGPALAQGTEAQRAACSGDAFRLCASSIPNVGRIAACLRRERESLSPACRSVLDASGGGSTAVAKAPPEPAPKAAAKPAPTVAVAPPPRAAPVQRQAQRPMQRQEQRQAQPAPMVRQPAARVVERPAAPVRVASGPGVKTRVVYRTVYVNRYVERGRPAVARQAAGPRGFASRGRGGSQMAQAMYWMRRVGIGPESLGGLASLSGGAGGMSLEGIRDMIPY